MELDESAFKRPFSRRSVLKAGVAGVLASQLALLERLAWAPDRLAMAAPALSDIQFDIGKFIPPAFTVNGVLVRFGPVYTALVPAKLTRNPVHGDRLPWDRALDTIEQVYPFSPAGVFTFVGYGLPYFNRLPKSVVSAHMPSVTAFGKGSVLKEAVPSPTDVSRANPGITKRKFNVPVQIEKNDLLITLRSDSLSNISDILAWLQGSNKLGGHKVASPASSSLIQLQTPRIIFQQPGLIRRVAESVQLPYAHRINPQTPMWMGFADQQVNAAGPPQITTFLGNSTAKLTDAKSGDYFDLGSIQHLSHDILDLEAWYETPQQDPKGEGETYVERMQYMFRSNQKGTPDGCVSPGNKDQFADGGGPSFLPNTFQGKNDALANINVAGKVFDPKTNAGTFQGEHRMGHISALQRSARAKDGTPLHIRNDGAGFSTMDVPDGSVQPKLEFMAFVPSADLFRQMRSDQAALDLIAANGNLVDPEDNGLERFITATRRQNFLVPPRRNRPFPLIEFT
jgi:hypothetical protein